MKRLAAPTFVLIIAIHLLMPVHQIESSEVQKAIKIGEIRSFNGAVLVRTKGIWGRLTKVPHPLFSTDKIVTKRGRAAVIFVDGGVLRVNIDSNVSIVQRTEMKGLFSKKPVTSRVINVLVGDVWFDVKVTNDRKVDFRTPSMTAAIRGTVGQLKAGIDGASNFGLSRGKADTSGKFSPIDARTVMDHPMHGTLPSSNPLVQRIPVMRAVNEAVTAHTGAANAASKAFELNKAAMSMGNQAIKRRTENLVKQAADKKAEAAVAKADASVKMADAQLATAKEAILEAKVMKDVKASKEAEKKMKIAEQLRGKIAQKLVIVRQAAGRVKPEGDAAMAAANAAKANTLSESAKANASAAKAVTQAVVATISGNKDAVKIAEKQLEAARKAAERVEKQEQKIEEVVQKLQSSPKSISLRVVVVSSTAIDLAASTIAINAEAQANAAIAANSGGLAEALDAAAHTSQMADVGDSASDNAVEAARTDNVGLANQSFEAANQANISAVQELQEIIDAQVLIGTITDEDVLPEQEDASPSQ